MREFRFVRALIKFERKLTSCARFVPPFWPKTGLNDRNLPFIYDKFAANAEIPHCSRYLAPAGGPPKGWWMPRPGARRGGFETWFAGNLIWPMCLRRGVTGLPQP